MKRKIRIYADNKKYDDLKDGDKFSVTLDYEGNFDYLSSELAYSEKPAPTANDLMIINQIGSGSQIEYRGKHDTCVGLLHRIKKDTATVEVFKRLMDGTDFYNSSPEQKQLMFDELVDVYLKSIK